MYPPLKTRHKELAKFCKQEKYFVYSHDFDSLGIVGIQDKKKASCTTFYRFIKKLV